MNEGVSGGRSGTPPDWTSTSRYPTAISLLVGGILRPYLPQFVDGLPWPKTLSDGSTAYKEDYPKNSCGTEAPNLVVEGFRPYTQLIPFGHQQLHAQPLYFRQTSQCTALFAEVRQPGIKRLPVTRRHRGSMVHRRYCMESKREAALPQMTAKLGCALSMCQSPRKRYLREISRFDLAHLRLAGL